MEPSEAVAKAGFSKDIADCDLRIQDAFPLVRAAFCAFYPDHDLKVDYTYRSPQLQFELFKKGRSEDEHGNWILTNRALRVTDKDGTLKRGEHNYYPSRAADIYITRLGKILWGNTPEEQALYIKLAGLWAKQGLVSGALWATFHDWPHVQVA